MNKNNQGYQYLRNQQVNPTGHVTYYEARGADKTVANVRRKKALDTFEEIQERKRLESDYDC